MAESAVERLKRLAREKREAAQAASKAEVTEIVVQKEPESRDAIVAEEIVPADIVDAPTPAQAEEASNEPDTTSSDRDQSGNGSLPAVSSAVQPETVELVSPEEPTVLTPPVTLQKASRNHPLVREMEELEAALEQNVPGFVTILRDIHKKLAEDPLTVTLLSLEERGTIVKGMTRHANVTIATKAVKSTSRSKKVQVTAADL